MAAGKNTRRIPMGRNAPFPCHAAGKGRSFPAQYFGIYSALCLLWEYAWELGKEILVRQQGFDRPDALVFHTLAPVPAQGPRKRKWLTSARRPVTENGNAVFDALKFLLQWELPCNLPLTRAFALARTRVL